MKYLLIGTILFWSSFVFSIDLIDSGRTFSFNRDDLSKYDQLTINTHRNKDGEELDDKWVGINLNDILNEYEIKEFDKLSLTSFDNYFVRIRHDEHC